jgi:hypothetical protein
MSRAAKKGHLSANRPRLHVKSTGILYYVQGSLDMQVTKETFLFSNGTPRTVFGGDNGC